MKTSFLELDQLGILASASLPSELDWLRAEDKQLLIDLHLSGESGMSRALVAQRQKKKPLTDCVEVLYANSMVDWLTDKQGRPSYLVLTPKGDEVTALLMRIAKNESQGVTGWPRTAAA